MPLGGWNPYVVSAQRFTLKNLAKVIIHASLLLCPHICYAEQTDKDRLKLKIFFLMLDLNQRMKLWLTVFYQGIQLFHKLKTIKTTNGKNIISKAWDNRYGCTVILEALEALQKEELDYTLIAGANVQEEVGLRGAKACRYKNSKPDLFFAVDCSAADDLITTNGTFGHLGEGTLLRIQDPGMILLPRLREYLLDTAETHNIPYQYFVSKGGTDAGAAHTANEGIPKYRDRCLWSLYPHPSNNVQHR